MNFHTDGITVIKTAISKETCRLLATEFKLARDLAYSTVQTEKNQYPFHDEMVDNSFSWYSPLCFEALSNSLIKSIVESTLGEEVYPTYSYARIYSHNAVMHKHTDRSSSEFSVSCCIEVDTSIDPWPINFENKNGSILRLTQEPGDIVMYKGNDLPHWRDAYHGYEQINAFMFYVCANGLKTDLKYDTRPMLGLNSNARRLTSEQQWAMYNAK